MFYFPVAIQIFSPQGVDLSNGLGFWGVHSFAQRKLIPSPKSENRKAYPKLFSKWFDEGVKVVVDGVRVK